MSDQLMNTPRGTYDRAVREGLGVSLNMIRGLIKSNTIPYVKIGKSAVLINYSVFKNYLYTGNTTMQLTETKPEAGQIKPIPEKLRAVR